MPGGGDPDADAALDEAEAEPVLYQGHVGQGAGVGRGEEGGRRCGARRVWMPALIEAGRRTGWAVDGAGAGIARDARSLLEPPLTGAIRCG